MRAPKRLPPETVSTRLASDGPLTMVPASASPLRGLTILVIDDHRDTVDMFQHYLTLSGAKVVGAGSEKAALGVVEIYRIDAAVVDLSMPREDGWSFLHALRASQTPSAQAPVFAMSGSLQDGSDPVGFAGYFLKPVELDVLVSSLAALPRRT
jgi:CheY-like chemotaxis protein